MSKQYKSKMEPKKLNIQPTDNLPSDDERDGAPSPQESPQAKSTAAPGSDKNIATGIVENINPDLIVN
jgi:hypothetical protein